MRDIHCPKDIGLNNIFIGEDCELEQRYDNCYHCWSSSIAMNNQQYFKRKFEEELEKIKGEIGNEFVDLQDGSEEWRSYVNDAVLSCYEIIEKHISELKGETNEN